MKSRLTCFLTGYTPGGGGYRHKPLERDRLITLNTDTEIGIVNSLEYITKDYQPLPAFYQCHIVDLSRSVALFGGKPVIGI